MKSFEGYSDKDESFWAYVKFISQELGYSARNEGLKRYTLREIVSSLAAHGLNTDILIESPSEKPTFLATELLTYLNSRAQLLEREVAPLLMDRNEARSEFEKLRNSYNFTCHFPDNKQKKEKRHPAYLTCIVNMLTEKTLGCKGFDDKPSSLIVMLEKNKITRTFSRWMDGAYPTIINPIAVWEIKEYYGTTTFGSRVADGVYETMLDGFEIKMFEKENDIKVLHYLIIDDRFTWWNKGKSYLCRMIDLLNMGLVDEVLFGREVLTRWPEIVNEWKK